MHLYYRENTFRAPKHASGPCQVVTIKKLEFFVLNDMEIVYIASGWRIHCTAEPTTAEPTTAEPTTSEPTTAEPTTSEPTTAEPTTSEPTTAEPTTAEPTTADPTTAVLELKPPLVITPPRQI